VVNILLIAARDFGSALMGTGVEAEALFGLEWLLKMWDHHNGILYFQVGIGDGNSAITGDHDLWRLPEKDDTLTVNPGNSQYYIKYRPLFAVSNQAPNATISPNLAGRVAAAFALCYQVFNQSMPTFASTCLESAKRVYSQANTRPGTLVTAVPFDYYPESTWQDDLELAAIELYRATNDQKYLNDATNWASTYIRLNNMEPINLYDVAGLAHYEIYKATKNTTLTSGLVASMKNHLDAGMRTAASNPFGFGISYGSGEDLVPMAFGYALEASFYAEMAGLTSPNPYIDFGRSHVHFILGNNAWGSSFIIGAGSLFPWCPQHQVANLAGSLTGGPPVLVGAVVDGPSVTNNFQGLDTPEGAKKCPANGVDNFSTFTGQGVRYQDNVASWPSVEPADDYSAPQVFLWARYINSK